MRRAFSARYPSMARPCHRRPLSGFPLSLALAMAFSVQAADTPIEGHSPYRSGETDFVDLPLETLLQIPIASASLFDETSWTSASSVARIEQQEWRRRGARRLTDAVEHLPGSVIYPFRFGANALALRGFAGSNLPRGTSLTLDGVPLTGFSNGAALVNLPNVELGVLSHIELVRGPASALYGSDAFFGVLALSTESPRPVADASVIEWASDDYYRWQGRYDHQTSEGSSLKAALAVSGQGDQRRVYRYTDTDTSAPAEGYRAHDYDSQTGLLSFAASPHADVTYKVGIYWNGFEGRGFPGLGRSQSPDSSALGDQDWSGSETDFLMLRGFAARSLSTTLDLELKSYAWRADVAQHTQVQRAAGVGENQVDVGDTRYGSQLILRRVDSNASTDWALALGLDRLTVHQGHLRAFAADGSLLADTDERYQGEDRHIGSVQAEFNSRLDEGRWRLVYGGRIDDYDDFGTQAMPRLAAIYQFTPRWVFKGIYGKAFRAPTAFEMNGIGNFRGNAALEPEIIDTLEWVVMTSTDTRYFAATAFYSEWRDAIVRVPIDDPVYALEYQNVEENRSRGLELDARWEKTPWWWDANASYTESSNTSRDEDYVVFPKFAANLGLGFRRQRWSIYFSGRFLHDMSSAVNQRDSAAQPLPNYWRMDLNLTKNLNIRTQLFFNVRNIQDRNNALPSLFNAEHGVPDESRSFSAGLRYSFD